MLFLPVYETIVGVTCELHCIIFIQKKHQMQLSPELFFLNFFFTFNSITTELKWERLFPDLLISCDEEATFQMVKRALKRKSSIGPFCSTRVKMYCFASQGYSSFIFSIQEVLVALSKSSRPIVSYEQVSGSQLS